MPDKLREMQELFLVEASKYNVFPLDNTVIQRALTPRPSATAGRDVFTYSGVDVRPDVSDAQTSSTGPIPSPRTWEVPQGGGDGMLATLGRRFADTDCMC